MNIIFLTLLDVSSLEENTIYTDLLRTFYNKGHHIYLVSPTERKNGKESYLIKEEKGMIVKVRTGNLFRTGILEKGISTVLLEGQYLRAIRRFFKGIVFDLILYSTPPINLAGTVSALKRRGGKAYLLLKDIFPQNAVDLGMFSNKSLIYKYFRRKEKKLYRISDWIGCMSPANRSYLLDHNSELPVQKAEICPNTVTPVTRNELSISRLEERAAFADRLQIPSEAVWFLYGGNLGKPQGIDHLLDCLRANRSRTDACFLICGTGTEYGKIEGALQREELKNARLLSWLPRPDYAGLTAVCDVGLIFLDNRFTIPNFPSRLLSYMEWGRPVLLCTDRNTDIGRIAEENGFGLWCESRSPAGFTGLVDRFCADGEEREAMGKRARAYLEENYTSEQAYDIIQKHF